MQEIHCHLVEFLGLFEAWQVAALSHHVEPGGGHFLFPVVRLSEREDPVIFVPYDQCLFIDPVKILL